MKDSGSKLLKLKGEEDRRRSDERSVELEMGMSNSLSTRFVSVAVLSALDVLVNLIFATI